jgi:hypothetical protein
MRPTATEVRTLGKSHSSRVAAADRGMGSWRGMSGARLTGATQPAPPRFSELSLASPAGSTMRTNSVNQRRSS